MDGDGSEEGFIVVEFGVAFGELAEGGEMIFAEALRVTLTFQGVWPEMKCWSQTSIL
jgi:hypothetical protein